MTDKIEWGSGTPGPWEFHKHQATSPYFGNIIGNYGLNEYGIKSIRTISCQLRYGDEQERYANARAIAEVPSMVVALRNAIFVFETYAENHKAKGSAEGDLKAKRNQDEADKIRAILARIDKGE